MAATSTPQLYGAIRSRTVAKLTGVSLDQLQYWHETQFIQAHVVPGARGYPRLYAWVDYLKVRAARKLLAQGIPTATIRAAFAYLDQQVPEWHRLPLYAHAGRVLIERDDILVTADAGRQVALPSLRDVLRQIAEEGPLGELRRFSDDVDMNPAIVAGNPVVKGTRLETQFVASLAGHGMAIDSIAKVYRLTPEQVVSAIEFQKAAA